MIKPINNCVLVEVVGQYEYAATPDGQYDTKTSGYVRGVPEDADDNVRILLDKRVWFKSYEDDIKINLDGVNHTLVEYDKIRGYDD